MKRQMWIVIACVLLGSASAFAQGGAGQGGPGVAWHELSPEQQQALAPLRERWDTLPPGRQQAMSRGAERWQQMTPEQRARAEERLERWRDLSPEQQQQLRDALRAVQSHCRPRSSSGCARTSAASATCRPSERERLRHRWQDLDSGGAGADAPEVGADDPG